MVNIGNKRLALLEILKRHPRGLTAHAAAHKLGLNPGTAGSTLSKLALYGFLDRIPNARRPKGGVQYIYRYIPPPPIIERAPAHATEHHAE